ncbi:DUF309 domain-containing protein [Aquicoccus sp.]|uniref:DUF309 domain-containing protein n=1 Tax=Aquicoccus sp. TaxID=2055851 RepID=UPI0035625A30
MVKLVADIALPDRAYVPGRGPRHPEGAFDRLRATARPGMSAKALAGSDAWRGGLWFLANGYFWEAHEVIEPVWMALPPNSAERRMAQAVIQLANGALKLRMGWPAAAARLADQVEALCDETAGPVMGILGAEMRAAAMALRDEQGDGDSRVCNIMHKSCARFSRFIREV